MRKFDAATALAVFRGIYARTKRGRVMVDCQRARWQRDEPATATLTFGEYG
jgi:hypothetical protein